MTSIHWSQFDIDPLLRLTSVISMNAAVSASVVLASRLPDDISVFALTLFSVIVFALFPVLRHRLQVTYFSCLGKSSLLMRFLGGTCFSAATIDSSLIVIGASLNCVFVSCRDLVVCCRISLCDVRSARSPCLGTEIQKVGNLSLLRTS